MRKSRYTDSQILAILKQNENGIPVPEPSNIALKPCWWAPVGSCENPTNTSNIKSRGCWSHPCPIASITRRRLPNATANACK